MYVGQGCLSAPTNQREATGSLSGAQLYFELIFDSTYCCTACADCIISQNLVHTARPEDVFMLPVYEERRNASYFSSSRR